MPSDKIKITYNATKDYVVINHGLTSSVSGNTVFTATQPTVGTRMTGELSAILKDDGTITVRDLNGNSDVIVKAQYEDFLNLENENFASSSLGTVDELNILFAGDPNLPPVITSPTEISGVAGTPALYQIEADFNPVYYDEENLPSTLSLNSVNGRITGDYPSTTGSPYTFSVIASNRAGADEKEITLTTFTSGTYVNNISTHFDQVAEKYARITGSITPANMAVSEGSAWSISFWIKPDKNNIMDIYFDGVAADAASGSLKIYNKSRRIAIQACDISGGLSLFRTNAKVLSKNTWSHVMCAYNGSTNIGARSNWNILVDGTSEGLSTIETGYSAGNGLGTALSRTVRVARLDNSDSNFLDGNLDEVYVMSANKTTDVSIFYNGGDPQDSSGEADVEAYWRMGEQDTYPIIGDKSGNGNDLRMINMVPGDFEIDTP